MRRATITAAAVLAGIASFSAGALAAAPYSVKLNVPSFLEAGQTFHLKATGIARTPSRLTVFITSKRCASRLATETKRSSHVIIRSDVLHAYTRSKAVLAREGTHDVCAYLTPTCHGSTTRAHAAVTYYVLAGGY
jgi:hypothetical protein